MLSYFDEIKDKQHKLAQYNITDPLTKLYNTLYFDSQILSNQKKDQNFWFMTFKIDRLDRVNQIYGLFGADKIIKSFAKLINTESISDSIVARLHGGSIGIIANNSSKKDILNLYQAVVLNAFKDETLANRITFSTIMYHINNSSTSLPHIYKKINNSMHTLQENSEHKYLIIE